jgi:hypothetical protein
MNSINTGETLAKYFGDLRSRADESQACREHRRGAPPRDESGSGARTGLAPPARHVRVRRPVGDRLAGRLPCSPRLARRSLSRARYAARCESRCAHDRQSGSSAYTRRHRCSPTCGHRLCWSSISRAVSAPAPVTAYPGRVVAASAFANPRTAAGHTASPAFESAGRRSGHSCGQARGCPLATIAGGAGLGVARFRRYPARLENLPAHVSLAGSWASSPRRTMSSILSSCSVSENGGGSDSIQRRTVEK